MHQVTSEDGFLEEDMDDEEEEEEEGPGGTVARGGARRLFDFVLCVGNFSARDEDIFVKLHQGEDSPSDEAAGSGAEGAEAEGAGTEIAGAGMEGVGPEGRAEGADEEQTELEWAAEEDNTEGGSELAHTLISRRVGTAATAVAPVLGLGGSVDQPALPILGVETGGCFTVTLGNRSTQARYFLQTTSQVQGLLLNLASVSAAAGKCQGAGLAAAESAQARLPNAMERPQLLRIQERLAKCLTPAFCLECAAP